MSQGGEGWYSGWKCARMEVYSSPATVRETAGSVSGNICRGHVTLDSTGNPTRPFYVFHRNVKSERGKSESNRRRGRE